jgi:hypothetical protein
MSGRDKAPCMGREEMTEKMKLYCEELPPCKPIGLIGRAILAQ